MRDNLDDELTEVKSENAVDRITSQANPRTLERVPSGAKFRVRLVLDILCEEDKPLFARVVEGLRLLEDDALGGGGSRGSGRVRLGNMRLVWRGRGFYAAGETEQELLAAANCPRYRSRLWRSCGEAGVNGFGFIVRLRPTGPWRLGPSSARAIV
jgi:CRISPR-associated protein Csm3